MPRYTAGAVRPVYLERKQGVPQGANRLHGDGVQAIRRQARALPPG